MSGEEGNRVGSSPKRRLFGMGALLQSLPQETYLLLPFLALMVTFIWLGRKARPPSRSGRPHGTSVLLQPSCWRLRQQKRSGATALCHVRKCDETYGSSCWWLLHQAEVRMHNKEFECLRRHRMHEFCGPRQKQRTLTVPACLAATEHSERPMQLSHAFENNRSEGRGAPLSAAAHSVTVTRG